MNPRSFKSIKQAVKEGRVKRRGDLARQLIEGFRKPINDAKKLQQQEIHTQEGVKASPELVPKQESDTETGG